MADLDTELESWRKQRLAELFDEWGWLSLAGLFWLQEGVNKIGPDSADAILLPRLEASIGVIVLENGKARFVPSHDWLHAAGQRPDILLDGHALVGPAVLADDRESRPSCIEVGDYRLLLIWRSGSLAIRLKDRHSEVLRNFERPRHFPDNPELVVHGTWNRFEKPIVRNEETAVGRTEGETYHGKVEFLHESKTWSLLAQERGNSLVIRFRDLTSGKKSYGAFRFLAATLPKANGEVVLDFNRAYNPPCAFTPWATCSLPPAENRLGFAVEAGELAP